MNNKRVFWKTFFIFLLMGLFGLLTSIPTIRPMLSQLSHLPDMPDLSNNAFLLLSFINPLILLILFIFIGNRLAPQLELQSHIEQWIRLKKPFLHSIKPHIIPSIITGVLLGVIIFLLDFLFHPWLPQSLHFTKETRSLLTTISGIFYGGIFEELLIRWGLMSLIIWLGWRFIQKRQGSPKHGMIWFSIILTSLFFAAGHLGSISILAPITSMILLRTFLLNGLVGIAFGWIFWKKGLEPAMIAHAFFHVGVSLIVHLVM